MNGAHLHLILNHIPVIALPPLIVGATPSLTLVAMMKLPLKLGAEIGRAHV